MSACLAPDANNALDDSERFNCSVSWSAVRNSKGINRPQPNYMLHPADGELVEICPELMVIVLQFLTASEAHAVAEMPLTSFREMYKHAHTAVTQVRAAGGDPDHPHHPRHVARRLLAHSAMSDRATLAELEKSLHHAAHFFGSIGAAYHAAQVIVAKLRGSAST